MIARDYAVKLAGYSLSLGVPLLAPLGTRLHLPWLAPLVVFGLFPILGLVVGEDRSLPLPGLRRSRALVTYLDFLPRAYGLVWIGTLVWAVDYAAGTETSLAGRIGVTVSVGIGSAVAICTAHELMHRRATLDVLLARLMIALCMYAHMVVEHFHHHATVGDLSSGATAPRGISAYRFAASAYWHGLQNAWVVETARVRRRGLGWWHNRVLLHYAMAVGLAFSFFAWWGSRGFAVFIGQAVFAVFVFEVITYLHHYGLVRHADEELGPQHAWAHHCWITNCLTFNNTFHSDHHLRPEAPYYELHAMHGAPRLPASYFTMFCVALVPSLWRHLMDRRLNALAETKGMLDGGVPEWMYVHRCR